MEMFHFEIVYVLLSALILANSPCHADSNANTNLQCSEAIDSMTENAFQENVKNLVDTLVVEGPNRNGFYETKTGKKENMVYGLIQCRGDVSASDFANCTKNATAV